jgi:hypothetical protein
MRSTDMTSTKAFMHTWLSRAAQKPEPGGCMPACLAVGWRSGCVAACCMVAPGTLSGSLHRPMHGHRHLLLVHGTQHLTTARLLSAVKRWVRPCSLPTSCPAVCLAGLPCSVRMSALALLKIAMHARSGGNIEVGLFMPYACCMAAWPAGTVGLLQDTSTSQLVAQDQACRPHECIILYAS